jgi:hypothetical protein
MRQLGEILDAAEDRPVDYTDEILTPPVVDSVYSECLQTNPRNSR